MTTLNKLPSFENPPLIEVALSVQFESLPELQIPQLGLLWAEFKERFPRVEQHTPVDQVIERIGVRAVPQPRVGFKLLENPPLPRLWFAEDGGNELVQVQSDFFGRNWRKIKELEEYPRYEDAIRPGFVTDWNIFERYVEEKGLGPIKPNQCSVTYVNHIVSGDVWQDHNELGSIFRIWNGGNDKRIPLEMEDAKFALRYVISSQKNEFFGRLHISVEPAFLKQDDKPIFVLTLTCRGKPMNEGLDGILSFMDLGRRHIVDSFDAITTEEMHEVWRKL